MWSTPPALWPSALVWGRRSSACSPAATPATSSGYRSKFSALLSRPEPHLPKKRLGQHFLKDPNTARIVARGVTGEDVVLEVGPGRGALTVILAEGAKLVHALELDPDVLPTLQAALKP